MRTVMLLIHLLLSSVSVECTTCDSFLLLFRNYVYYHFIFPKINKRGGWNKSGGGWKIFQKLISGRDDYSVLESNRKNEKKTQLLKVLDVSIKIFFSTNFPKGQPRIYTVQDKQPKLKEKYNYIL